MTLGPTLVMKVPGCKNPVKFHTVSSGNTFGATFWTDGKRESPMLPDNPWLKKSPTEGVLFWSDQCEEIGRIDFKSCGNENHQWKNLDFAVEPTAEDYITAINCGLAKTDEQQRYLRMRLWWIGNDAIRRNEQGYLSEVHLENLRAFVEILSEADEYQRLVKAEALRELSEFDAALELLASGFSEEYSDAVDRIRQLVKNHHPKVAKLS